MSSQHAPNLRLSTDHVAVGTWCEQVCHIALTPSDVRCEAVYSSQLPLPVSTYSSIQEGAMELRCWSFVLSSTQPCMFKGWTWTFL